jgi:2-polyprenyl-3-methyl-5-hydroxy-6-metoxy-1,4-benzoquinol methylase
MFFLVPNLAVRDRQPELMDQPGLSEVAHHNALRGLARVNRLSFSAKSIWRPIVAEMRRHPPRQWRLLDVACGSGDVPLTLARYAASQQVSLHVAGCDMSETAVFQASSRANAAGVSAEFFVRDVIRDGLPDGYDFITCSLFLHHLENEDVVTLLRAIGRSAGTLGVISDLRRTQWGYAMAAVGVRLLSRSRIVHIDGPLSVRGAFSTEEAESLAEAAGLNGRASVRHIWPQRFLMTIGPLE